MKKFINNIHETIFQNNVSFSYWWNNYGPSVRCGHCWNPSSYYPPLITSNIEFEVAFAWTYKHFVPALSAFLDQVKECRGPVHVHCAVCTLCRVVPRWTLVHVTILNIKRQMLSHCDSPPRTPGAHSHVIRTPTDGRAGGNYIHWLRR